MLIFTGVVLGKELHRNNSFINKSPFINIGSELRNEIRKSSSYARVNLISKWQKYDQKVSLINLPRSRRNADVGLVIS